MRTFEVDVKHPDIEYKDYVEFDYITIYAEDYNELIDILKRKQLNGEILSFSKDLIWEIGGDHNYEFRINEKVDCFGKNGVIIKQYCPYDEGGMGIEEDLWYDIFFVKEKYIDSCEEKYLKSLHFIYFVQDTVLKYIKIGYTNNIKRRIKDLQVGNPHKLELIAQINGGKNKEEKLHKKFDKYNIRNEWFEPNEEILKYISEINVKE